MKKRNFGNVQVELDVDATTKWYAQSKGWGCECGHCRNFLELAHKKELPSHIIKALEELGIPPEKATYVGELFKKDTRKAAKFQAGLITEILKHKNTIR